jgi:hypothetical protein
MRCPYCGAETDETSATCARCGGLIRSAVAVDETLDVSHLATPVSPPYSPVGYPYPPPPVPLAPPARRRFNPIWLLTFAVLLLVAAVLFTQLPFLHRHGQPGTASSPVPVASSAAPTTPSAAPPTLAANSAGYQQAQAIDGLINAASSSRSSLGGALSELANCGNVAGANGVLQRVTQERTDQLSRAQQLVVRDLPNGEAVKSILVEALSDSLQADRAYLAWAQDVASSGCGDDQNRRAGDAASGAATGAKQRFVQAWNPLAAQFGLAARAETDV